MTKIISCDWGTSSLRLRLVDADNLSVLAEVTGSLGILGTFESWKKAGTNRLSFYTSVLKGQMAALEEKAGSPLKDEPLVVSGMASSNIGMVELPYKELPFSTAGYDLGTGIIEATDDFRHPIILVSGVRTERDVIRGEEAQLIGAAPPNEAGEQLFLFPGTHSKHILVKGLYAVSFRTYMTGEFFALLSAQSILSGSVEKNEWPLPGGKLKSFGEGVIEGAHANLLQSSFLVRTNDLFQTKTKEENYHYLSGLCIGAELRELAGLPLPVTVVGTQAQKHHYLTALGELGVPDVQFSDAGQAVVQGHCKIYRQHLPDIKPS